MKKFSDTIKLPTYRVLPLKDLVVFPNMVVPLIVGRKTSLNAIDSAMENEKLLFLVAQKDSQKDEVISSDLYRVGVVAKILQLIRLPNGLSKILVEGVAGGSVKRYLTSKTYMRAGIDILQPQYSVNDEGEAKKRQLVTLFKKYVKLNEDTPEEVLFSFNQLSEMAKITDYISTHLDINVEQKQEILQKWIVNERVDTLIEIVKKENKILAIKLDLNEKVKDQGMKSQRNFYLHLAVCFVLAIFEEIRRAI